MVHVDFDVNLYFVIIYLIEREEPFICFEILNTMNVIIISFIYCHSWKVDQSRETINLIQSYVLFFRNYTTVLQYIL